MIATMRLMAVLGGMVMVAGMRPLAADDFTYTVTSPGGKTETITAVDSPNQLIPPCHLKAVVTGEPADPGFQIDGNLTDDRGHEFNFDLKNGELICRYTERAGPGGFEDYALQETLKKILAETYNSSLEKEPAYPYIRGREDDCKDQLALQYLLRLLDKRISTHSKIDPRTIEFYPNQADRRKLAGMLLRGPDWKEVAKVSDLEPPCEFMNVQSVPSGTGNDSFVLVDGKKNLLQVDFSPEAIFIDHRQSQPGSEEEQQLLKITSNAYQKIYDPKLDHDSSNDASKIWYDQRTLKEALKILEAHNKAGK